MSQELDEAISNQMALEDRELPTMDERDWPVYAVLLKTGELYWHDVSWGNRYNTGNGWLMVLPWGEQRERGGFCRGDNRFGVEHEDVSAFTLLNPAPVIAVPAEDKQEKPSLAR